MIRRPPRSTPLYSSAASDVYKRQQQGGSGRPGRGRSYPGASEADLRVVTQPGRTEQHVLLGGRVILASEACLSVFDRGVLYGESVFETVKVRGGIPCLWEPHRDRLRAACVDLNLFAQDGVDAMITDLEDGIARLLNVHPVERGALRAQVTGGDNPGGARGLIAPMEERSP